MPRKPYPAAGSPEEHYPEEQELLPPGAAGETTSSVNEINLKVQHVHEQLLDLRRQQEEIERQKKELEELSRKQREFDEGQREVVEKLRRGLVLLESEEFEVKRELEQIKLVRDSFAEHLAQTENLNPANWSSEELSNELTKALARIDQARAIHGQAKARLSALRQAEEILSNDPISGDDSGSMAADKSFGSMVREGFAYSLPVLLFLALVGLLYLFLRH